MVSVVDFDTLQKSISLSKQYDEDFIIEKYKLIDEIIHLMKEHSDMNRMNEKFFECDGDTIKYQNFKEYVNNECEKVINDALRIDIIREKDVTNFMKNFSAHDRVHELRQSINAYQDILYPKPNPK